MATDMAQLREPFGRLVVNPGNPAHAAGPPLEHG
jgi:hypothetical protein